MKVRASLDGDFLFAKRVGRVLALQCQQPAQRRDPAGLEPQGADVGFDRILAVAAVLAGLCKRHPDVSRFRSEEHTSELQSLMRISYAVFCLKKKKQRTTT